MRQFFLVILSVFLWIYFILSSIFLTPLLLVIWFITILPDKKLKLLHLYSCFWGAQYIWAIPLWKLKITGREKLSNHRLSIMVSNHQSLADILVIYSIFKHFRWVSKVENFRFPFVGWVLSLNRSIRVYRGSGDAWKKFEEQAVKSLEEGNSIMMFPEGTRSKTSEIGKFKEGAFRLALQTRTDIQPMVLDGTSKAIPKSGWILKGRQKMVLKVLDPLPYESFRDLTPAQLADKVHAIITASLTELRQNLLKC